MAHCKELGAEKKGAKVKASCSQLLSTSTFNLSSTLPPPPPCPRANSVSIALIPHVMPNKPVVRYQPETGFWVFIISLLLIIILVLVVVYFAVFQPKDPTIHANTVSLGTVTGGPAGSSVSKSLLGLTLGLYVSVHNPNRANFHFDMNAYMYYGGIEIGFSPVTRGVLRKRSRKGFTFFLTANEVPNFMTSEYFQSNTASGIITVTVKVQISGNVTVLNLFTHHATTSTRCVVSLSLSAENIVAYNCNI